MSLGVWLFSEPYNVWDCVHRAVCAEHVHVCRQLRKINWYLTNNTPSNLRIFFFYCFVCVPFGDPGHPQWMEYGMSGPAGAPVRPPALMGPCKEPGSVTAPHTEARSAEESGWRLSTASWGSAQVWMTLEHSQIQIFTAAQKIFLVHSRLTRRLITSIKKVNI